MPGSDEPTGLDKLMPAETLGGRLAADGRLWKLACEQAKPSADPDTVERVMEAIHAAICPCHGRYSAGHTDDFGDVRAAARAAINAIGGGDAD